jgi:hypothetical protein
MSHALAPKSEGAALPKAIIKTYPSRDVHPCCLPWSRFYFGNDEVIFATCSVTFRHLERRACSAAIASRSSVRAITASVGALVGKLLNR